MNSRVLFVLLLLCGLCVCKTSSDNKVLGLLHASQDLTDTPIDVLMQQALVDLSEYQPLPEDCSDVQKKGYKSGVYQVRPLGAPKPYLVSCDLDTNEGRWTVIQHRFDGKVDFYRNYSEFTNGFGKLTGEHWIGLEIMHQLTSRMNYELYIVLEDFENEKKTATYKKFAINSKEEGYRLNVGEYSGDAGDSLTAHNMMKFTTFDKHQDLNAENCAVQYKGAWWHKQCHTSNLNGLYSSGVTKDFATGMVWEPWKGYHYSLKTSKIMMRPVVFGEFCANYALESNTVEFQKLYLSFMSMQVKMFERFNKYEEMHIHTLNIIDELIKKIPEAESIGHSGKLEDGASNNVSYPEDCAYVTGHTSGIYFIKPPGAKEEFSVYCELDFENKRWTVIQNRFNGKTDFYRYFKDYQNGFGDLSGEHWLGLEHIYQITKNGDFELYIELSDFDNATRHAVYGEFSLCSAADGYRLNIDGFSGNAGDSLTYSRGQKFTTHDRDLDTHPTNCAKDFKGAWWYAACHESNLNGYYHGGVTTEFATGMVWKAWREYYYSLKTSRMLIRMKNVRLNTKTHDIDVRGSFP